MVHKEQCQICNRATAETFYTLTLYGRRYDSRRLWNDTVLEYEGARVSLENEDQAVHLSVGAR
jgi:hypothetical protein